MSAEWLLTFTQLHKKGLKPVDRDKPDACYYRSSTREFIWLYDERQSLPRRKETEAQKEGHKRAWTTTQEQYRCTRCENTPDSLADLKWFHKGGLCENCAEWLAYEEEQREIEEHIEAAHHEAVTWAMNMTRERDDWVLLDTETTDLYGYVVEIAVIDAHRRRLFQSLVNPRWKVAPAARAVHGIPDSLLHDAPTLPDIWSDMWEAIGRRTLLIAYNAEFDRSTLERDAKRWLLRVPFVKWECAMLQYAAWFGEWSDYHGDLKWQRLPGGSHTAEEDARATLALIQRMAR